MTPKAQNVRPHNLSVKQPGTQDYMPPNDGFKRDIVEQSDRVTVGVTEGKDGSVSSSDVGSFSRSHD